jgi:ubiquinone/menaquinone biosynthesis C-methylase UbiE
MKNRINALQKIFSSSKGYRQATILLTANKVGIFAKLSTEKMTAEELSKDLKIKLRGTIIILNALVNLGFLKKKGNYYQNCSKFIPYLCPEGEHYIWATLEHDFNLLKSWSNLPEILKTGRPVRTKSQVRDKFDQETFILTMANSAIPQMKDFYNNLDLSSYKSFLDIGGGPGVYSLFACKKYPNLTATNFDIAETNSIARKYLSRFPESKRIKFMNGSYFTDNFGENHDVVLISSIIHSLGEKDIIMIFKKAYNALNDGGMIIVKDFYFNNDRVSPEKASLFAVNMLVNTEEGDCYTVYEVKKWLKEAGFGKPVYKEVNPDIQFIKAFK